MNVADLDEHARRRRSEEFEIGRKALSAVLQRWKWIVAAMVATALAASAAASFLPKYQASGFYYTSGWSLAEFKRFRSEFGSSDVLASFLRERYPVDDVGSALLLAHSLHPGFWETAVKPLYPITKKDAKEIFETTKDRESSSIIGLELSVEGPNPSASRDAVLVLGNYITQTLLLSSLQNWVVAGQSAVNGELLKAENQVLQTRYSIEQSGKRVADLVSLQTKYPESKRMEARQVVSADAASARYLAPVSQVIAIEAGVAELNESLRRMERRVRQLRVEAAFFNAAAQELRETLQGWTFLQRLTDTKQGTFHALDSSDDATKEVSNRFDLELKGFKDQFSIAFGFRSPVLEPTKSSRSPTKMALTGALVGLLAGILIAICLTFLPRARVHSDRSTYLGLHSAEAKVA